MNIYVSAEFCSVVQAYIPELAFAVLAANLHPPAPAFSKPEASICFVPQPLRAAAVHMPYELIRALPLYQAFPIVQNT